MKSRRFAMAAVSAIALGTRAAAAQDPRLVQRFDADAVRRIDVVIDSAARESLPTEPLVQRALEGGAKGAPLDRIVLALAALHGALRIARQSLGLQATPVELSTGAAALEAGVPAARLVELRRLRGGKPVTAPLGAYLDLVARGAEPDRAWNQIADLARRQASDAAYQKLTPMTMDRPPPAGEGAPDPVWEVSTLNGRGQLDHSRATGLAAMNGRIVQPLGRFRADVEGSTVDHAGIGTTGAMSGDLLYRATRGGWNLDLGGVAASGRDVNESWTNAAGVMAASRRSFGPWSIFADLRGGLAQRGTLQTPWITHTAGAAFAIGGFRLSALWRGNVIADSVRDLHVFGDTLALDGLDTLGYTIPARQRTDTAWSRRRRDVHDVAFAAAWSRGRLALSGQFGRRFGDSARAESWFSGTAAFQLTPTVAVVASAGRSSADLLLGLRGGRTVTLGLRLSTGRRAGSGADAEPSARALELIAAPQRMVRLIFVIPAVQDRALLNSDLTAWSPVPLARRADGRWEALLPRASGVHRFNLQVDGGGWRVPPGMIAADDGFGGKVGLLVVEEQP